MKAPRAALFVAQIAIGLAGCVAKGGSDSPDLRQKPPMDAARACDVHELMMAGSSPTEQQTMLEQYLKAIHGTVDPEMVARHRQAMTRNCPAGGNGDGQGDGQVAPRPPP